MIYNLVFLFNLGVTSHSANPLTNVTFCHIFMGPTLERDVIIQRPPLNKDRH